MNKTVSVIIPCYNGEQFIDRCINSVVSQDYPSIEIIIVNDGSTDKSEDKILSWKKELENTGRRLIYVKQENKGSGAAVNTGLKYVSGEYISLLDVDDEYLPGCISERAKFLNEHCDIDVVRSNGWYVRGENRSLFIYDEKEKNIQDVFSALIEGKTNNWAGSFMVRASALFAFYPDREIFQSRYGQNLQFLMPLVYKKKCGYIDEPHMNYNQQENSLSKTTGDNQKEFLLKNQKGYRKIREHMINLIVLDKKEKEHFFLLAKESYLRGVIRISHSLNDKELMKDAFFQLKEITFPKLDDTIKYCELIHPCFVPLLRLLRKIKTIQRRIFTNGLFRRKANKSIGGAAK